MIPPMARLAASRELGPGNIGPPKHTSRFERLTGLTAHQRLAGCHASWSESTPGGRWGWTGKWIARKG